MMTADEFCKRAVGIVKNYKTCYCLGGFGHFCNDKNIKRELSRTDVNNKPYEQGMRSIENKGFIFDCVGLIKGILWGWHGDSSFVYGGAVYISNDVPDVGANGMIKRCNNVSTDFSNIQKGEVVWLEGHIGIYVGEVDGVPGCVVECTPRWNIAPHGVKISGIKSLGYTGSYSRTWTKHGFLPFVDYTEKTEPKEEPKEEPKKETEEKGEIELLYHTIDDVPDWGKEAVKWFVDKGYIAGVGGGDLSLTNDLLRTLVVLYRVLQNNNITQ